MAALKFSNVSHTYKAKGKAIQALREVSFEVHEGEVFGFVGPNGAGKSTTIKVMLDIINNYQGKVEIYGTDAHDAKARFNLAFVPESPALYENFTPLEILKMGLSMHRIKHKDTDAHCMHWLERFDVAKNAKRRIRELSKGNVQRVALAHALAIQPKLLILDEPLSGLDPVGRKDVVDILNGYKQQGGAIFFTSHVLHDVERIADRFAFINQGQLVTIRSPQELVAEREGGLLVRYYAAKALFSDCTMLRAGEYETCTSQHELPQLIHALNAQGGLVISVKPAVSLESLFFKILKESTPA